jgi:hypothetical protein
MSQDLERHILQDVLSIRPIHAHACRNPPQTLTFPQEHA